MTRIETPILRDEDDLREQTEEEVIETLHLALKEAKDRLTQFKWLKRYSESLIQKKQLRLYQA